MPISMKCPQCGKKLNAPDSAAGKRARCPHCKTIVTLPAASAPPPDELLDAEPMQEQPQDEYGMAGDAGGGGGAAPPPPLGDEFGEYDMAPTATPPPTSPPSGGGGGGDAGTPRRPCPMCGEMIPVSAVQCRFCHEIFDPKLKKVKAKKMSVASGDGDDDLSVGEWLVAIFCSGIGCILGIIWMIQGKPKGKKMFGISILMGIIWRVIGLAIEAAGSGAHHGR
jgi:hypothetical protein